MSVCLDKAGPEVLAMAREIMEAHHPHLQFRPKEWATLSIQMAYRDDASEEPCLKDGPYPVLGQIKAVAYEQRVDDCADARLKIDQAAFRDMTDRQQRALLDHLITSLEFQVDDVGAIKTDDAGRPKLKVRACDWRLSGFRSVAMRYGDDAHEVIAARKWQKSYGDVVEAAEVGLSFA